MPAIFARFVHCLFGSMRCNASGEAELSLYGALEQACYDVWDSNTKAAFFSDNRQLHMDMISLRAGDYREYAEAMKRSIRNLLSTPPLLKLWKSRYYGLTAPASRIYDSSINGTMAELSPRFAAYRTNVHAVCDLVYGWLQTEEGKRLKKAMEDALGDAFDIEHCSHGELQAMAKYGEPL